MIRCPQIGRVIAATLGNGRKVSAAASRISPGNHRAATLSGFRSRAIASSTLAFLLSASLATAGSTGAAGSTASAGSTGPAGSTTSAGSAASAGPAGSAGSTGSAGSEATSAWSAEFDIQGVDGVVRTLLVRPDGLWVGGEFALAGDRLVGNAVRIDGGEWTNIGDFDDRVSAFAVHEGRVVAGGRFTSVDGTSASRIAVHDETAGWTPLGTGFENREDPTRCEVHTLLSFGGRLFAGGEFTHAGGEPAPAFAVWDGSDWGPVPGGALIGPYLSVHALAEFAGGVAVGGEFDKAGDVASPSIAVWREESWVDLGGGLGGIVQAFHVRGDTLFVGGFFRLRDREVPLENFAVWDGSSWDSWGSLFDGIDPTIRAIDEYRGDLIVAGEFQRINGTRFEQVARWDGSDWRRMSAGFVGTGGVHDLTNWGNYLTAGGAFSNASGHSGWGLARWAGAWNPVAVGHGMNGPVYALAFDGEKILAGGSFSRAGRVAGDNASLWSGNTWVALGADFDRDVLAVAVNQGDYVAAGLFNGYVNGITRHVAVFSNGVWRSPRGGVAAAARALTVYDGEVVVGGAFARAGGRPAERIASWNGDLWNPLGAGLSDTPYALGVHDGELVAGGRFLRAGGLETPRLAFWDGANWLPLPGGGPDADVLALTSLGTDLIVAGEFLHVDDLDVGRIASWDGTRWRGLGSGFDGPVRALTVHDSRLVAGGSFSRADGKPATGIAFWDGWSWNPLDEGVGRGEASVHALLSDGDRLIVGGNFELASGVVSLNFAIRGGPIPLQVWPGDCDNNGRVDGFDLLALGRNWERSGPTRGVGESTWAPEPAEDWDPVAATYADADGSGTVDLEDLIAIVENWAHDRTDGAFPAPAALPEGASWLNAFPDQALSSLHRRLGTDPVSQELRGRIEEALGWGDAVPVSSTLEARVVGTPTARWPELSLSNPGRGELYLELVDVTGRRLAATRILLPEGNHRVRTPRPVNDPGAGVYFLRLSIGNEQRTLRFVKFAD